MTDLPLAHLGETLYRSGYTEPRLRQFWGAATSEALLRNNAAPAIHHCTRVLNDESSTAADRAMATAALLFHFHRTIPVT